MPTQLRYVGPLETSSGDELSLVALLTDESGRPLVARQVHFVLGSLEATAVTDELGLALTSVTPTGPPASLPLTVTYAGDDTTAPASASATVVIKRALSVTRFLGPTVLATGKPQQLRAALMEADGLSPIAGRPLVFEAGSLRATGTTDAAGVATASLTWSSEATGPAVLRVSFAGDDVYAPSSDEAPITRYLPTAFTLWGGNTPGLQPGQRVNFWGHSWAEQVRGGDYASHAEFKGFAAGLKAFALCQPTARTVGGPLLTPECWGSKGGQSNPPARLPEFIGVLVADSIAKEKGQTYGNVAALAVLRVEPEPAYGPVPGKPGWGTLVAVIDGGAVFPRPAALSATQRQPEQVHPGQGFDVMVELANTSPTRAEQVIVSERFQGSLPASEQKEVGTLGPDERRTVSFSQTAPVVAPRGDGEPVAAYQTRLAAEDGRLLSSLGRVGFVDPSGTNPPALHLVSSSRRVLPRLSVALSAPPCAGPCTLVPYTVTVAHVGQGRAKSATARVTLPDGSQREFELGALEPRAVVTRTVEWTVSDPGPRGPDESLEAYLERLSAWSEQNLNVSARVEWTDEGGNTYGPLEQQYTPVPRVAFLAATAERPDTVLPGQSFPLQFTVTNLGKARAWDARLQLTEGGAASAPFSLAPEQSTPVSMDVTALPVALRGDAEPEAAYRARLVAADGRALTYGYSLDWGTVCGSRLGPISGSVRTFLVLPLVDVLLSGPAEAQAGERLTYELSLRNTGFAEARSLTLLVTLPDGSTQEVSLPVHALARGASVQVPVSHTLSAGWNSTQMALATASIRWMDAAGGEYGALSSSTSTKVLRSNQPPLVDAGLDQSVRLPAVAMLSGQLVDDGLPEGAVLTAAWVQVSGPAVAWFADASKAETSVTFPEPGTYVLRLVGSDSQLTARDEVVITVLPREGSGTTLPGGTPAQRETLVNLVRAGEQIQIEDTARSLGFIWVAVSTKGTIVKIDTETGAVLGEYYSSPNGQPRNPSRTTVDLNGNVWAGNRDGNSVVHIGLVENGQCEDRNGNGLIETSRGLGDVRAWPNWGGADTNGGVSTADDECILHYTRVNSYTIRHVSVDRNNDVWVSGTDYRRFDLVDGRTGIVKRSEPSVGWGGYGGLIDSNGVIWSSNPLLRWDTALPLTGPNGGNWKGYHNLNSYGLCVGPDGSVWSTASQWSAIHRFSPAGDLLGSYGHGNFFAQGCTVDRRGHVWVAHGLNRDTVGHLKPDGSFVGSVRVGSGPTGASVDNKGRIWVSNNYSRTVSRIDPLKGPKGPDGVTPIGEVDFTSVNLGGEVYNYSDMTGSTLTGSPLSGLWTVVHDSGQVGSEWGRVAWAARVCGNGSLKVTVASSEDGVVFGSPAEVRSSEDFNVPNGRYLRVNTAFRRSDKGESPVIYGMTMGTARYEVPSQVNAAPDVHAGRERVVTEANPLRLTGSACDDGLPAGGPLAMQWSQVGGPGTATFSAPGEEVTDVTFTAPGTYVLRLTASDSALEAHSDVTVTVVKGNSPPEVAVDSPKSVTTVPGSVLLTAHVSDDGLPAGSAVIVGWTKVSGPGTVSFENASAVPTTATFNKAGTYVVRLTASDVQLSRSADVLVQVGGTALANAPPQVSAGPGRNLTLPTRVVTLKGSVTDDGQPAGKAVTLTWSQVSGPSGVVFASPMQAETGVTLPGLGAYVLRLTASDSQLVGSADVRVVVEAAPPENQAPVVSAGMGQTVALPPGRAVLDGRVLDDGQPEGAGLQLTWSAVVGPGPVAFTDASQAGTEAHFSVPGDYMLRLWASDSERSAGSAVRVAVRADLVNAPPVVAVVAPSVVNLPSPALLSGSVRDEGLPVTGSLTVAWSQVSGPGTVTFSLPDRVASRAYFSAPGEYVLRLTASDSKLNASSDVTVRVLENNAPPVVFAGADQELESSEQLLSLYGSVSDDGLPLGASLTITWSVVLGTGPVTFSNAGSAFTTATFTAPGDYVLRLTASDSALTASSDVRVRVLAPSVPLEIPGWIGSPAHKSAVSQPVPIQLIPGVTLANGTIDYWPASDPGAVTVLAANVSGSGTLAIFDPTLLSNDSYVIRLRGTDNSGVMLNSGIQVTVMGEYKPGRVSFEVTDLTIPVSGLPITIGRTYDSLERAYSSDFGHGWSLTLGNPRLEVDQAKNVTLTQPDGERVTFYFSPESYGGIFGFLLQPKYLPEARAYGTLRANGCNIVVMSAGRYVCFLDDPEYAPTVYTYTDPYGQVFTLGADGSLKSLRDLTGTMLAIGPEGITSSAGNITVDFDRDAQGRITTVTDPVGNQYRYTYDGAGNLSQVFLPAESTPLRYTYDATHLLLSAVDARGNPAARVTYYPDGRIESETDALGYTTRYTYALTSRTTTLINPEGGVSTIEYDVAGQPLRVTDPLGRTSQFTYDGNSNRLSEINPLGEIIRYTYDSKGHVVSRSDPLNNTMSFLYNDYGGPTQITDPLGNVLEISQNGQYLPTELKDVMGKLGGYSWDSRGNPLTRVDADGREEHLTYDVYGNVLTETDVLGNTISFTYDLLGRRTSRTDALGRVSHFSHDPLGRVVAVTEPLGLTTTYEYDANGNEIAEVDSSGHGTRSTYDAANRLIEVTYPDGTSERYSHDFRGNRLTETDRAGRLTRYEYDLAGQLVRVTTAVGTPDESTTAYTYDAAGRRLSETNALGQTTTYAYDAAGRLIRQTDEQGNTTSHTYDASGQRTSVTDPLGRVTRFSYDARGRPIVTTLPDGTALQRQYNASGQMVARIDQANRITRYQYDGAGRLVSVTDPLGQTTRYAYDVVGNLLSLTDANGHTTGFAYDDLNRLIAKTWPDGTYEAFEYDLAGNPIRHQLADGEINRASYDVMGRLIRAELFDGQASQYSYTPTGYRASVIDARGTTHYAYDNQDRLISVLHPSGQQIGYSYDAIGNRRTLASPVGTISYEYDDLNRLVGVADWQNRKTTYTYNVVGLRTQRSLPNGITTAYDYDLVDRLTSVVHLQGGEPVASYNYTLDAVGNRQQVLEGDGTMIQWRYDVANRLLEESVHGLGGATSVRSYAYDAVGNRLSMTVDGKITTYSYNVLDQLLRAGSVQYSYDGRGNLVEVLDEEASTRFSYDAQDWLSTVVLPDGTSIRYLYDADGRRVTQEVGAKRTHYLWDVTSQYGDVVLETGASSEPRASYLLGGNELIAQKRSDIISYYLHDGHGSVRALAAPSGAVTDLYRYTAYGEVEHLGATVNPYQYTGQQFDALTGLYSLRARDYSPSLGRFVSRDRAEIDIHDPMEFNRYGYARSNPIMYSDPTGYMAAGEYGSLARSISIRTGPGARAIGKATQCLLLRSASRLVAANKNGLFLLALMLSRPERDRCIIPVFVWAGDSVAYHIEVAQFERGRPMLKSVERTGAEKKRRQATKACRGISRSSSAWGPGPSQCDEYPYASTHQGGHGSSVMIVPAAHNNLHGQMLKQFYRGGWSNRWRRKLRNGTDFATVILFGLPPLNKADIRP